MVAAYDFAICARGTVEILGAIELKNDAEAVAHGKSIINDLMRESLSQCEPSSTMVISKGKRTVARIPLR